MNKEFTRMLKLAGLMTEGLYTSDAKASMEAMSHDGESRMTKRKLKEKIKGMMLPEETPGEMAYAEMGSMDEYDTQGLTNAASVVDHYLKAAYDAGSTGVGFDDSLAYEMMDHLKQFSGEMGGMNEVDSDYTMAAYRIAREMVRRMDFPDAMFGSKDLFLATIKALQDELYSYAEDQFGNAGSAPDEYDDYDDSMDVYDDEYPDMAETMFEAKKDEEADTEDVIVADTEEVPAEDAAVDVTVGDTQVDVNMDGVPDVDTGSAESKKAFTSLVDTYNASKELGDPKLTQMIANALTYYNKNIILKAGQPQA
jgi:hypothetical protein